MELVLIGVEIHIAERTSPMFVDCTTVVKSWQYATNPEFSTIPSQSMIQSRREVGKGKIQLPAYQGAVPSNEWREN